MLRYVVALVALVALVVSISSAQAQAQTLLARAEKECAKADKLFALLEKTKPVVTEVNDTIEIRVSQLWSELEICLTARIDHPGKKLVIVVVLPSLDIKALLQERIVGEAPNGFPIVPICGETSLSEAFHDTAEDASKSDPKVAAAIKNAGIDWTAQIGVLEEHFKLEPIKTASGRPATLVMRAHRVVWEDHLRCVRNREQVVCESRFEY